MCEIIIKILKVILDCGFFLCGCCCDDSNNVGYAGPRIHNAPIYDNNIQEKTYVSKYSYQTCSQCGGTGQLPCSNCNQMTVSHCGCGNRCHTCGATGYQKYLNW